MEKGLAAIFVVLIHCKFPGTVGDIFEALARFAVPLFFMVSGFFSYNDDKDIVSKKLPKKIKHIFSITITANIFYIIYDVSINLIDGTLTSWISSIATPVSLIQIFITNSFFSSHLWFLFALIACYLILFAVNKLNIYKSAYILIPIVLIIHFALSQIGPHFYKDMPPVIFRNFALFGFPFFMLGNFIAKHKSFLCCKLSNTVLIIAIVAGSCEAVFKRLFFSKNEELFLGTVIAVTAMFIFAFKNEAKYKENFLSRLGDKNSLDIYIMQWIVIGVVERAAKSAGIYNNIFLWVMPVIVIILCIFVSKIIQSTFKSQIKKS